MMHTSQGTIVVGAGFAGLSAALELHEAGIDVAVLEARERVGGRVWSTTLANGAVVELGGGVDHARRRLLTELALRSGLSLAETGADYGRREPEGPDAASLPEQERFVEAAHRAWTSAQADGLRGVSLNAFLDGVAGEDHARRIVKMRLQGTFANDLDLVPARTAGGAFGHAAGAYRRIGTGNQSLATALAAGLPEVRTGHVVDAVEQRGDRVVVRMGEHEERAEAVVIAVPAPIVARMRFTPALPPDVARAYLELPMGMASKFAVATKGRPTVRARQAADLSMWCWVANGDDGRPRRALASFAGSPSAQHALGVDRGQVGPWLEKVRSMNPDLELDDEPVVYAWGDDPFTLGAYSAWDEASWERIDRFTRMVGRVAFAGEHTAGVDLHGTMEGALRSGRRAAAQVLSVLS